MLWIHRSEIDVDVGKGNWLAQEIRKEVEHIPRQQQLDMAWEVRTRGYPVSAITQSTLSHSPSYRSAPSPFDLTQSVHQVHNQQSSRPMSTSDGSNAITNNKCMGGVGLRFNSSGGGLGIEWVSVDTGHAVVVPANSSRSIHGYHKLMLLNKAYHSPGAAGIGVSSASGGVVSSTGMDGTGAMLGPGKKGTSSLPPDDPTRHSPYYHFKKRDPAP
ncbi:hypothetical protein D9756_006414 [Leucocoprinus leucothites]|uniref:Uncharacterized protein n=1 Tax=Leucocoprinus leucothites TaxID=201217 RepID=A0A8H5G2I5_9AGAR|nr:hypothetical protein D9756_006414 [Leucoagaricus leucothites]